MEHQHEVDQVMPAENEELNPKKGLKTKQQETSCIELTVEAETTAT